MSMRWRKGRSSVSLDDDCELPQAANWRGDGDLFEYLYILKEGED